MEAEKWIFTLILNHFTSRKLKRTLILAETLTSDPYNGGQTTLKKETECNLIVIEHDFL